MSSDRETEDLALIPPEHADQGVDKGTTDQQHSKEPESKDSTDNVPSKVTIRSLLASSSKILATQKDILEGTLQAETSSTTLTGKATEVAVPLLEQLSSKNQQIQVLADKAALLLGLANKFENSERGKALQEDAQKFLAFAGELRNSEQSNDILARAQSFADTLMEKYETQGQELFADSQKLWESLMTSTEANDFIDVGENVFQDWLKYGETEDGQKLVQSIQDALFSSVSGSSDGLLALAEVYSADAEAWLAAMDKNKITINKGLSELQKTVQEDEELAELVNQSKSVVTEKMRAKKEREKQLKRQQKNSSTEESDDKQQEESEEEDPIKALSQTAHEKLTEIQTSESGKKALQKGTTFLKELHAKGELDPAKVISALKNFQNDPTTRQELITKIKDAALEFLLSYLPEVTVPPLVEDTPKHTYSLRNIDLSGFKVKTQDVDVALLENGVVITAKNISCVMKNLQWTYKSKKFPYVGSHGDANASAFSASIRLILEIEKQKLYDTPLQSSSDDGMNFDDFLLNDEEQALKELSNNNESTPNEYSQKFAQAVEKLFQYEYSLVLVKERSRKIVEMPYLEIEITNNWLSSVMNVVLGLLRDRVREYVEEELNNTVLKHSDKLLGTINDFSSEYLPLFAAFKDKVVEKAPKIATIASNTLNEIQSNVKNEQENLKKTTDSSFEKSDN